jgi:Predicted esterase of the alpha-beta hydrolase superfamily
MRWELGQRHRLGIALSGGGARGFAHIRVLRVLVEAGWRPAVVTGTSAGGIVGGLFAAGLSPEAIEALARASAGGCSCAWIPMGRRWSARGGWPASCGKR